LAIVTASASELTRSNPRRLGKSRDELGPRSRVHPDRHVDRAVVPQRSDDSHGHLGLSHTVEAGDHGGDAAGEQSLDGLHLVAALERSSRA
jgi:hypothetical protein